MHRHSVNLVDAIAEAQSGARCRRILERRGDIRFNRIADGVVLYGSADAKVFAALVRLQLVEFFFIEIV